MPHRSFLHEPNEVLQTLAGRGLVSAEGVDAVRVRYRVVIERRDGVVVASGTLIGTHAGLRPIWLAPDSTLRLKNGRQIAISVTDLVDETAEFESTAPVSPI